MGILYTEVLKEGINKTVKWEKKIVERQTCCHGVHNVRTHTFEQVEPVGPAHLVDELGKVGTVGHLGQDVGRELRVAFDGIHFHLFAAYETVNSTSR